jgi:hypothetical protein
LATLRVRTSILRNFPCAHTDFLLDANAFKDAFIKAQKDNEALFDAGAAAEAVKEDKTEETKEAEAA